MPAAEATRGGMNAGLLQVEQADGPAVAVPPPPPPAMVEGERCFRARMREYRYLLEDRGPQVLRNGEEIPGKRRWIQFKAHASGLFGEYVTNKEDEIEVLEELSGMRCREHKRPLDACRAARLRCRATEAMGEVWEAVDEIEAFDDRRAQQVVAELAARPALLDKVRVLGEDNDLFLLEPQQRKPKKAAKAAKPDTEPSQGFDLDEKE